MKAKTKAGVAIGLSVIILSSVVLAYKDRFGLYYMTFWSNTLAGIILFVGGICLLCGRDIPSLLYLNSAALLGIVICVCGRFGPAECFCNASVVLHIVNPCLMMIFYIVCCDGGKWRTLPTVLIFPLIYYAFIILYGRFTGGCVYPNFDPNTLGILRVTFYGIAACALLCAITAVLMLINRFVSKRIDGIFRVAQSSAAETEIQVNVGNEKVRYG